jgi:hypothetical protein
MMHFSHCPKNVLKTMLKKEFEIVLCLESADSNCTAVFEGRKIQNTKQHIFGAMEIIPIFFQEYQTFRDVKKEVT